MVVVIDGIVHVHTEYIRGALGYDVALRYRFGNDRIGLLIVAVNDLSHGQFDMTRIFLGVCYQALRKRRVDKATFISDAVFVEDQEQQCAYIVAGTSYRQQIFRFSDAIYKSGELLAV